MSFCEGCIHKHDEICSLFDDILAYENCIFQKGSDDE